MLQPSHVARNEKPVGFKYLKNNCGSSKNIHDQKKKTFFQDKKARRNEMLKCRKASKKKRNDF